MQANDHFGLYDDRVISLCANCEGARFLNNTDFTTIQDGNSWGVKLFAVCLNCGFINRFKLIYYYEIGSLVLQVDYQNQEPIETFRSRVVDRKT